VKALKAETKGKRHVRGLSGEPAEEASGQENSRSKLCFFLSQKGQSEAKGEKTGAATPRSTSFRRGGKKEKTDVN